MSFHVYKGVSVMCGSSAGNKGKKETKLILDQHPYSRWLNSRLTHSKMNLFQGREQFDSLLLGDLWPPEAQRRHHPACYQLKLCLDLCPAALHFTSIILAQVLFWYIKTTQILYLYTLFMNVGLCYLTLPAGICCGKKSNDHLGR